MKILHISSIGLSAEGIGTVISKLIPEQIKQGNDVRILSTYENLIYKDLNILNITNKKEFIKLINEWTPDIVQFHSVYRLPFIYFYKVLRKKNIPYLIQMHGALSEENFKKNRFKKIIANTLLFNNYLQNANAALFLNKEELNKCVVKSLFKNTFILPNGCDKVSNVNLERKCKSFIDIVFLGRVSIVHKGIDVLCDAIDLLMKNYDNTFTISFYANPNDDDLPILKNRIKRYGDVIKYKGGIYGDEKDKRLRETDIFILTSRFEGMPMALLEALSYGIPAIVTPGTNMADMLRKVDAGWIAELSPESIAKTIKQAINQFSNSPTRFRECAYELGTSLNWENIAKQSIEIYKKIIK